MTARPAWRRWKPAEDFDLAGLAARIWPARCPAYARPLFLRLVPSLAVTETFKQKKQLLAARRL